MCSSAAISTSDFVEHLNAHLVPVVVLVARWVIGWVTKFFCLVMIELSPTM